MLTRREILNAMLCVPRDFRIFFVKIPMLNRVITYIQVKMHAFSKKQQARVQETHSNTDRTVQRASVDPKDTALLLIVSTVPRSPCLFFCCCLLAQRICELVSRVNADARGEL